jgi:TRAP-type uncharacterized transport system fused permease subunit
MEVSRKKGYINAKMALVAPCLLVLVLLLMLRLHGTYSAHWSVTFIPLWVLDGVSLIWLSGVTFTYIMFQHRNTKHEYSPSDESEYKGWHVLCFWVFFGCSIPFEILLSVELSSRGTISMLGLFTPLVVLFGLWSLIAWSNALLESNLASLFSFDRAPHGYQRAASRRGPPSRSMDSIVDMESL